MSDVKRYNGGEQILWDKEVVLGVDHDREVDRLKAWNEAQAAMTECAASQRYALAAERDSLFAKCERLEAELAEAKRERDDERLVCGDLVVENTALRAALEWIVNDANLADAHGFEADAQRLYDKAREALRGTVTEVRDE